MATVVDPRITLEEGGSNEAYLERKKYEIMIEAEGADGLQAAPGTEVCFLWRRRGKVSLSESTEVWEDGVAYWDAKCSQVATLTRDADGGWRPKPCEFLVQAVPLDDYGIPKGLGCTIASAKVDLSQFCSGDDETTEGEDGDPRRVVLPLEPAGELTIKVAMRCLHEWQPTPKDPGSEASEASITPTPSCASLHPEESSFSVPGGASLAPSTAACSPAAAPDFVISRVDADNEGGEGQCTQKHRIREVCGYESRTPEVATPGLPDCSTPTSSALSSALARSTSSGSDGGSTVSALQRRCKRLARERDEARAEAFAEASVAVQRGIEIENLKRAKEVLMQRLTTTERQMMAIMRLDADSPSSMSGGMLGEAKGDTGDSAGGGTSMLHALVEAKLALAEKEFEVMELQGKCRAKEVHIEALTDHLSAIRASMEAERRTISASTPPSLPRLRVKSRTPQSRLAPAGELVAAVGTAEKRSQSSSPVVQIFAHAGPA